jgi:hypothetical protein
MAASCSIESVRDRAKSWKIGKYLIDSVRQTIARTAIESVRLDLLMGAAG